MRARLARDSPSTETSASLQKIRAHSCNSCKTSGSSLRFLRVLLIESVRASFALKRLLSYAPQMISFIEAQPAGSHHDLVKQVEEIFSPTGILSRAKNFEFRPQQQQMAVAVARALENREHLAVEAGTGVGKSLAYLIPAILFAAA